MYKSQLLIIGLLCIGSSGFLVPFGPYNDPFYPPICKNCINAQENHCKLFGHINLINGMKHLLACDTARRNETLCGKEARFYTRYVPFSNEGSVYKTNDLKEVSHSNDMNV